METPEFHTPSDDEFSEFLEGATAEYAKIEADRERKTRIAAYLHRELLRNGYERLTPQRVRYMQLKRETILEFLAEKLEITSEEAEDYYDAVDDQDFAFFANVADVALEIQDRVEVFLIGEMINQIDAFHESTHGVWIGSQESFDLQHAAREKNKELYAYAVLTLELPPNNPVLTTICSYMPGGKLDLESDEMLGFMAEKFIEDTNESKASYFAGALIQLGVIPGDETTRQLRPEEVGAVASLEWNALTRSGLPQHEFESHLRSVARTTILTHEDAEILVAYFTECYYGDATSQPDEAA